MSIVITFVVSALGIIGGKFLFRYWVNHLTLYSVIWGVLVIFYEWKLLPYVDIIPLAWFFIISVFLSFLFGILTVFSVQKLFSNEQLIPQETKVNLKIFSDKGRAVKYGLITFSGISIFAAIQHWMVLIDLFGSLPMALLNANIMYKLNTLGGVEGVIPYISNFGFAAVFLSGIYTAYKGRFSLLTFLPFVGIVLKSMATVGRVGMLFAMMEFFLTFFLFRYLLIQDSEKRFKFSRNNAIIASTFLIAFFVVSASLVRLSRVTDENLPGTTKELRQLQDNFIISPSIYLYLSSDLGVLTQYLKSDGEDTKFGENTFMLIHMYLGKFKIIEEPNPLQKGYNIPMWINTGTFIRELHADFGTLGVFLFPYFLGFIITWLWFRFYQKHSITSFALLIYFTLIVGFSFLMMITRLDIWGLSIIIVLLSIPILERLSVYLSQKSITNYLATFVQSERI